MVSISVEDSTECAWAGCAHPSIRTTTTGQPTLRSGGAPMRTGDECSEHATRNAALGTVHASGFSLPDSCSGSVRSSRSYPWLPPSGGRASHAAHRIVDAARLTVLRSLDATRKHVAIASVDHALRK